MEKTTRVLSENLARVMGRPGNIRGYGRSGRCSRHSYNSQGGSCFEHLYNGEVTQRRYHYLYYAGCCTTHDPNAGGYWAYGDCERYKNELCVAF